ncbi:hypothetical protein KSP39_PZI019268 [Platanthera zijinensis]|uniref:Uncharacterized protein n=1 Tax=Platanthera zijinensis TaxID=2320716 RepID=A0AAP0FY35_9ASPA
MKKQLSKFPLSGWEVAAGLAVLASFMIGLLGVYLSMPPSDYSFLRLPRTLEELQTLSSIEASFGTVVTVVNAWVKPSFVKDYLTNIIRLNIKVDEVP